MRRSKKEHCPNCIYFPAVSELIASVILPTSTQTSLQKSLKLAVKAGGSLIYHGIQGYSHTLGDSLATPELQRCHSMLASCTYKCN